MVEDQKIYVTPTRILDAGVVGDVEYFPVGSQIESNVFQHGEQKPEIRQKSEFHLRFKDSKRDGISLYGEDADTAWKNYRLVAGPTSTRLVVHMEEPGSGSADPEVGNIEVW
jgi:hypothetical protein